MSNIEDENIHEKDLITIIVPVYNVENYLQRCVNSILNQSYKRLQILLINDGSSDSSGEICDKFASSDLRVKVVHKKNGGLSDARNAGLLETKGKYVSFIDSDDYIFVDYIAYLYGLLKNNHAEIAIGGLLRTAKEDNNYQVECPKTEILDKKQAIREMLYARKFSTSAPAKLYLTELFENVRFPLGKFSEDLFTIYKVLNKANNIVYGNQVIYYYYYRVGSIVASGFSEKQMDVIDALKQIKHDIPLKKYGCEKAFAAQSIECINGMFERNPKPSEIQSLGIWEIYKQYRKNVIFDSNACKRTRVFALLSYCGLSIMLFTISNYYMLKRKQEIIEKE